MAASLSPFSVVFATGGSTNAKWQRAADIFKTEEAANRRRDVIVRMGYPAYTHATEVLETIGLPEGPAPKWDYTKLCWK